MNEEDHWLEEVLEDIEGGLLPTLMYRKKLVRLVRMHARAVDMLRLGALVSYADRSALLHQIDEEEFTQP